MSIYTKHQVLRFSRPDKKHFNRLYLIKVVTSLRATYQIRTLAAKAASEGLTLVIKVPKACKFHASLRALIKQSGTAIKRENFESEKL